MMTDYTRLRSVNISVISLKFRPAFSQGHICHSYVVRLLVSLSLVSECKRVVCGLSIYFAWDCGSLSLNG